MSDPREDSDLSSFEDLVVDLLSSIATSAASIAKTLKEMDQHTEQRRQDLSAKIEELGETQRPVTKDPPQEDTPLCPECASPMRKRKGSRGLFWGCSSYPQCYGTRSVDHPDRD